MPRVVLGLLAAGGTALFAVTRVWASATVSTPGLPSDQVSVSGVDAAPILAGLAVVIMAAALGVVAAGGRLRQLIGLLIAAGAGLAALRALTLNPGGPALGRALLGRALKSSPAYIGGVNGDPSVNGSAWPWLAAFAFVVAAALGVVVVVRGRAWPRMSARYEREAPSVAEPADEADIWRAQDAGEDPTLGDGPR